MPDEKHSGLVLIDDNWAAACRRISKAEIEPQPFFVTFTCYGTWLHGDARGHVVVTVNRRGKRVLNDFKSYATRRMKEAGCLPEACLEVFGEAAPDASSAPTPKYKVWTRGGSARRLDTENSFRRAIEYTLHAQGPDL